MLESDPPTSQFMYIVSKNPTPGLHVAPDVGARAVPGLIRVDRLLIDHRSDLPEVSSFFGDVSSADD